MAEMHMKRHMPQIYLSKQVKEGRAPVALNDFNAMLKKSLLCPRKQRYVSTKREHQAMEKLSKSPRNNRATARSKQQNRTRKGNESIEKLQGGNNAVLPIISLASSNNSVDYQQQEDAEHLNDV